jgi:prevent-host-death family protein
MAQTYSTYEAKAKFSELLRKVRAGQRVLIAYHGKAIAEIRPLQEAGGGLEASLKRLEDEGILSRGAKPARRLRPLAKRPGALARFLESRD